MSFDKEGYEWEREPDGRPSGEDGFQRQPDEQPDGPAPGISDYPVPAWEAADGGEEQTDSTGVSGGYPPGQNSMAMASMVCGIVSFFGICCCGIGGIIMGSLAVIFGLLSRTEQKFESRAVAGIIMGAAAAVISVAVLVLFLSMGAVNLYMGGY